MSDEFRQARGAALTAGEMLVTRWAKEATGVNSKSTVTDLVSDADRAAEDAILRSLSRAFPEDSIVAEEGSLAHGRSSRTWYVDPLDGTINYLYHLPHWAVALALADEDGIAFGLVFDPVKNEMFHAERGTGAFIERVAEVGPPVGPARRPIRPSSCDELGKALVATGFSYSAEDRATQGRIVSQVLPEVRDIRRFGSASLDLAYVAAGRVDAYFESVDKPWDWMAGALLVREAGGVVTRLEPVNTGFPRVIASGKGIHDRFVALLDRATRGH
jgi:myo-inositol-1(or 4)-monophosphatase